MSAFHPILLQKSVILVAIELAGFSERPVTVRP